MTLEGLNAEVKSFRVVAQAKMYVLKNALILSRNSKVYERHMSRSNLTEESWKEDVQKGRQRESDPTRCVEFQ